MKNSYISKLRRDLNNKRVTIFLFLLGIAGVILLIMSILWLDDTEMNRIAKTLLRDLASWVLTSVILGLIWELLLRRSITEELLDRIKLSQNVIRLGIAHITFDPQDLDDGIDWIPLIRETREFDLFFMHGIGWRLHNHEALRHLAHKPNVQVRILLPDPDNHENIEMMIRSTGKRREALVHDIKETITYFNGLNEIAPQNVVVALTTVFPAYTIYRFDKHAIITVRSLQHTKVGKIPHLVGAKGGELFNFVVAEFNDLWSRAKIIT